MENQIIKLGKNFRLSEFTAALGCVQLENLENIINWKNEYAIKLKEKYKNHLKLPKNMRSGYYKFIIFDKINFGTGKVYDIGCHHLFGEKVSLQILIGLIKIIGVYQYIINKKKYENCCYWWIWVYR